MFTYVSGKHIIALSTLAGYRLTDEKPWQPANVLTMASISLPRIPVVDVMNCNMKDLWPDVLTALKDATFVAIDCVGIDLC